MENRLSETGGKVRDRATKGRLFGRGGESTHGNRGIRAFETWEETWRGAERIRRKVFVAPIEKVGEQQLNGKLGGPFVRFRIRLRTFRLGISKVPGK